MFKAAPVLATLACSVVLFVTTQAQAQTLRTNRVASGLARPVFVTAPTGDNNRLFIVEQRSGSIGRVRILDLTTNPPTLLATPYLSISPVNTGNEEGLLGMAFHPDFLNNGYFWVYYTNTSGNNVVVRYRANAPYATSTTANATGTLILTLSHPTNSNHNGGWIGFAPGDTQGYLHINTGDGGSGNDPPNNAQNINSMLGKMLRLDIDGADGIPGNDDDDGVIGNGSTNGYTNPPTNPFVGVAGLDEIWHYGLRNPWRASFDRLNGDLYIGDVGQNAREEIDYVAGGVGGKNFGWRCMEGNICSGLSGCTCNSPALTNPIHWYVNPSQGLAVIGGYVYRGPAIPWLQGTYFFSDNSSSQLWTFIYNGSVTNFMNRTAELTPPAGQGTISSVSSFGEDNAGEMYIVTLGGSVYKILPGVPANDTCAGPFGLADGANAFTNENALTNGFDEPGQCNFNGYSQIGSDVWYKYTASCTGTVTISACSATFNTKIAVYGSCPTASGQALACNDDFCGTGAQVSVQANAGQTLYVRVGGYQGASGTGTINVSCEAPQQCVADVNGDNTVNFDDILAMIFVWGPCAGCPEDADGNGEVNFDDVLLAIFNFGKCP